MSKPRSLGRCTTAMKREFRQNVARSRLISCRAIYSGAALAFRDRLVIDWNKTQQEQTLKDQKRVYCKFYLGSNSRSKLTYYQICLSSS